MEEIQGLDMEVTKSSTNKGFIIQGGYIEYGSFGRQTESLCYTCQFYDEKEWISPIPQCRIMNLMSADKRHCEGYRKKENLLYFIKVIFYNFILGFQDEEQLNSNPEWVRFLASLGQYEEKNKKSIYRNHYWLANRWK